MITAKEILDDLDGVISKVKWYVDIFPKNEIWLKIYGDLSNIREALRKDSKIYNY